MADLKLTADFTDLQTLKRELLDIPKKARDSARTFETEFARAERILAKQAQQFRKNATESQNYYSQLLQLNRETKSAEKSAQVFAKELERQDRASRSAAKAVEDAARELDRLKAKYDPLYASSKLYERSLEEINLAHQKGAISAQRQIQLVDQLNAEYQQFASGSTAATNRFVTAQVASSRGMNAMGVGFQQAGYQIGDFLVQVQSGTNWMVAFGQQATQLVGILPMFNSVMGISGTALVALSAGLGIAIPLVTAIGAAFMRTRQNAEESSSGINTLEDQLKSARQSLSGFNDQIERLNLGLADTGEQALARGIREAQAQILSAEENLADARDKRGQGSRSLVVNAEAELQAARELLVEREKELENYRQRRAEAERLSKLEEKRAFVVEQSTDLENQLRLSQSILSFGQDSAEVEAERARQARDAYLLEVMRKNIYGEQLTSLMDLYDESVKATEEAERNADAWSRVSAMDLGSLNAQVKQLMLLTGMAADEALRYAISMPIGVTTGEEARGGRGPTLGMEGRRMYQPNAPKKPKLGSGGAGEVDPLVQLQEQIRLEEELLGKTEAQRRVIQALGIDWKRYGDATIDSLIASIEEMDRFNERVAQQQQIADTIKDSMSEAFMSMVDGTKSAKDAFRDMARAVIKQLYDILVVQQLVGSFNAAQGTGSGIVGAIMGAFTGAKASGGSMMANRPYLVGERGPELVIPGRSATVTNADLTRKSMGGSDGLVVNNNITVNGGNDPAAIRMEVAKLMPQITNATKTAVIDARRRGGQMRAAFQ